MRRITAPHYMNVPLQLLHQYSHLRYPTIGAYVAFPRLNLNAHATADRRAENRLKRKPPASSEVSLCFVVVVAHELTVGATHEW